MAAPDSIYRLVATFDKGRDRFTSRDYNETEVRVEFINPFFEALGWDVTDSRWVYHEAMVLVEENARMKPKHPDYGFLRTPRTGAGTPNYAFFVEAKAPHVDLKGGVSPAYQVRRYGWSARLPASVLTDFEEFSLYDCRVRPDVNDKPSRDRLLYLEFTDYVDNWDTIESLFSYEAIIENQLDAFVREKGERGASTVDDAFLRDLEAWRVLLAKEIALHNPGLTRREINMAVQLTIDRIVFLRICEDRGIEGYGRLRDLQNSSAIYPELAQFFRQADTRYNSGLFHFSREAGRGEVDDLTLGLTIPNEPLSTILGGLYYPTSPYEFSVLPAEILGQVYERFLGSVIELSEGGLAEVVEKPEVRKAGGVYYTPTYIVDYIVQNTVGKLLEGVTPDEAASLRILDPACGSGSFLIGAYQYLLDWHLDYYENHAPRRRVKEGVLREVNPSPEAGAMYRAPTGSPKYALTTGEKKRILLNNIYGVDLDQQAVEVSKLSLLLKMLEGETASTATGNGQLELMGERILPDLSDNIKWGNSLIGPDFYHGKTVNMFDEETLYKVKAFDWESRTEGFGEIMAKGGFDAVIGNPPYVKEYTNREPFEMVKQAKLARYYQGKMDLWYIFACHAIDLLKVGGLHSFIATNNWITNSGASLMREKILTQTQLQEFVDFGGYMVFQNASVQTMVYQIVNTQEPHHGEVSYRRIEKKKVSENEVKAWLFSDSEEDFSIGFQAAINSDTPGAIFTFVNSTDDAVLSKIEESGQYRLHKDHVGTGIDVHQDFVTERHLENLDDPSISIGDGIFVISDLEKKALNLAYQEEQDIIRPYYTTNELTRFYGSRVNQLWVIYTNREAVLNIDKYPHIKAHLDKMSPVITSDSRPYGLHRARKEELFLGEKIISLRKTSRPHFTYTDFPCYVSQTFNVIQPPDINLKYLTGILNSTLSHYWLDKRGKKQGNALQIDKAPLLQLPIRTINFDDAADVAQHDRMVALVERMLDLHKQLPDLSGQAEKTVQAQIAATDREIDALVYELYGLTDEEVAIVEGD